MKFFKNGIIVFLSAMVFLTSSGLTVNLHYCAGKLAKVGLQKEHVNCMMDSKVTASNFNATISQKNNCCQNQQVKASIDQKINDSKVKQENNFLSPFTFIQTYFTSIFSFGNNDEDQEKTEHISLFPMLKEGLYILLQQFRN
ncbi:MAG: hypothetical protein ABIP95_14875 [Pelobium sp.]